MRQDLRKSAKIALTSVLSIALCASIGLCGAQAQNKKSKDKMKMDTMHQDMMANEDMEDAGVPVAPSYPWAAPGTLDLNHWSDYRMKRMHHGSATESRMDMQNEKMKPGSMAMGSIEDEEDRMPTAPSYPNIQPGMIDMYHWTDYRHKRMKSGSASDARMDKERMKDKMVEEDVEDRMPLAPDYPYVNPGTVDMSHWTDYRQKHMAPGSASEARMDKMNHKEMKKMSK
jgi:hypothetical protein